MHFQFRSGCHTHTHFCDGKASPAEMAKAAYEKGFVSLGFSAHSPLPYENDWALTMEKLPQYIDSIRALKEDYRGKMEIVLGIELDADSELDLSPFAYTLGSVHTLHKNGLSYPVDCGKELLSECCNNLFDGDFYALMRYYFENVYNYAKRCPYTVLGHYDLPLKYNKNGDFIDENDPKYQALAMEVLDGILDIRPDVIFEINTGAILRAGRPYAYPAPFLLKRLIERKAPLTLTADAHTPEGIDTAYEQTTKMLAEMGLSTLYRLENEVFLPISMNKS